MALTTASPLCHMGYFLFANQERDMKIIASNGRAESFRELTHVEHQEDGP